MEEFSLQGNSVYYGLQLFGLISLPWLTLKIKYKFNVILLLHFERTSPFFLPDFLIGHNGLFHESNMITALSIIGKTKERGPGRPINLCAAPLSNFLFL